MRKFFEKSKLYTIAEESRTKKYVDRVKILEQENIRKLSLRINYEKTENFRLDLYEDSKIFDYFTRSESCKEHLKK